MQVITPTCMTCQKKGSEGEIGGVETSESVLPVGDSPGKKGKAGELGELKINEGGTGLERRERLRKPAPNPNRKTRPKGTRKPPGGGGKKCERGAGLVRWCGT